MGEQGGGDSKESLKLGRAIQLARQNAAMTQQDLCHHASLSYSTLAKIERGAIRTPSVFTVYRIAQVLGVNIDDLLGSVTDKPILNKKQVSKSGVSFIFFDVNGCLVRFFHRAFTRIAADTNVSSDIIETAFWHFNDLVCKGDMSMDEFNVAFAKQVGIPSMNWNQYYFDAVEPIPEMHDLVRWAGAHYRIGLLSNIMPGQIATMLKNGTLPNIPYDTIVDSSTVKSIKPEEEIYTNAERMAGAKPEEILLVDDGRTNLMAAERRGWKVLWFDEVHAQESVTKVRSALEF